jgi:Sulfotransferase domain
MSGARWPNLFVAGAGKAGTTTLWRQLGRHPEIWMSPVKEPNFFSGVTYPLNEDVHDEADYLRLFAPGTRRPYRGEASNSYLWTESTPERIRGVSPDARILISLRDPVERAYSHYWYTTRTGVEDLSFPEAIRRELREPRTRLLEVGHYAGSVDRYLRAFPGTVHVLFLEDLERDLRREMRRIYDFLGVDAAAADRAEAEVHNSRALPRNRLARSLHNSRRVRAAARAVAPRGFRIRAQQLLLKRSPREPMDPAVEAQLTELFAPEVERLKEILGRDVPWPRFGGAASSA